MIAADAATANAIGLRRHSIAKAFHCEGIPLQRDSIAMAVARARQFLPLPEQVVPRQSLLACPLAAAKPL
jgi:hypothetical protein